MITTLTLASGSVTPLIEGVVSLVRLSPSVPLSFGAVAVSAGTAETGSVGIGGFGGKVGASGAVTLTRVGDTLTDGANSDGIIAQSIAGGGGQGGINVAGGLSATTKGSAGSFGFGLGGFGGDGGPADQAQFNIPMCGVIDPTGRFMVVADIGKLAPAELAAGDAARS